jgi:Flp pilus assembly protein TadD
MRMDSLLRHGLLCGAFALLSTGCSPSNVEKGAVCLRLGDHAMAREFFEKALSSDPRNFEARLGLGKALLQAAVDNKNDTVAWREACRQITAARTLRPSDELNDLLSQAWSERGRALIGFGDTLSALEALIRAIEYGPRKVEPLNTAGIIYFRMGEIDKSRALLNRALQLDSANTVVLFNLGMVSWHAGAVNDAHAFWLRTLTLAPKDTAVLYWFAAAEKKMRGSAPPSQRESR